MAGSLDYIIFTDGSMRRCGNYHYAGYGAVLYNCSTRKYTTIGGELGDRPISFAEHYAILKSIGTLVEIIGNVRCTVLVISDSKNCVMTYRDWIDGWIEKREGNIWCTLGGKPVSNQRIIKAVKAIMDTNPNITFRFAHINSHKSEKSMRDRAHTSNKLEMFGVNSRRDSSRVVIHMNGIADKIAGHYSFKCMHDDSSRFITLRPTKEYYIGRYEPDPLLSYDETDDSDELDDEDDDEFLAVLNELDGDELYEFLSAL